MIIFYVPSLRKFYFALMIFLCLGVDAFCQTRYIVVERIGGKRIRLVEGNEFHFKLFGEKALFNDIIASFGDSIINIASGVPISLNRISSVQTRRSSFKAIRMGMQTVGIGFIAFPTLAFLTSNNSYSPKESIIIGSSLILISQIERLIPRWKKYNMTKKGRIWMVE